MLSYHHDVHAFTYLRLGQRPMEEYNYNRFSRFVASLKQMGQSPSFKMKPDAMLHPA